MLLLFWIVAFFAMSIAYTIYYNRWQRDYMAITGAEEQARFRAFLQKHVEDPGLERRRMIGSYAGYALIGWGIMGLFIPVG